MTSVEDPYSAKGSIAPDGRTLVARAYLDVTNPNDIPVEATERLLAAADAANHGGLNVALAGRTAGAEIIGLIAAAVLLLIMAGKAADAAIGATKQALIEIARKHGRDLRRASFRAQLWTAGAAEVRTKHALPPSAVPTPAKRVEPSRRGKELRS